MDNVQEAMKVLKEALQEDDDYAHSWHCNIAMMCYDAIRSHDETVTGSTAEDTRSHLDAHEVGNDAASRFMKIAFDIKTSNKMLE